MAIRRRAIRCLAGIGIAGLASVGACPADDRPPSLVRAVAEIGITVDDLDRSVAFFTGVLGFEEISETEVAGPQWERRTGVFGLRARVARLRLGAESIELWDYLAPRGQPLPWDTRANDRWFQHLAIVVRDLDEAYGRLRAAGVEHASSGPQCLPQTLPAAAGICAFYFRDPDGHFLELIEFPPGKGDARWHPAGSGALFLGIDHTAIVVSDTEAALRFYRDELGLRVAGTSENFGTEQQHLNNVEGAHLRITTMRAEAGPGIELLEYLAPRSGRALAQPLHRNDLAWWQTSLDVSSSAADPAGTSVVASLDDDTRFEESVRLDPDGHAVLLRRPLSSR